MTDNAPGFVRRCSALDPTARDAHDGLEAGMTVREVARLYRVGEDKVRGWIARGELPAINTAAALVGRPRWVIMRDDLVQFEKRRRGGPAPKPQRRRRKQVIDFYPD